MSFLATFLGGEKVLKVILISYKSLLSASVGTQKFADNETQSCLADLHKLHCPELMVSVETVLKIKRISGCLP
jgi:hypothetical protein